MSAPNSQTNAELVERLHGLYRRMGNDPDSVLGVRDMVIVKDAAEALRAQSGGPADDVGKCPFPIENDDGTQEQCIANGHCGCVHGVDAKDAARYRWLREASSDAPNAFIAMRAISPAHVVVQFTGEQADRHIDALMAEQSAATEERQG